ncbi:MAG: hypothetical protein A4E63_01921 [Syntrophorhabdus sp. PtaU1.Bin050]|nr:MAG: hypothetical protein A4E63_01921 [Syntrophorhabdus sp. PtaU1.Bin050]
MGPLCYVGCICSLLLGNRNGDSLVHGRLVCLWCRSEAHEDIVRRFFRPIGDAGHIPQIHRSPLKNGNHYTPHILAAREESTGLHNKFSVLKREFAGRHQEIGLSQSVYYLEGGNAVCL